MWDEKGAAIATLKWVSFYVTEAMSKNPLGFVIVHIWVDPRGVLTQLIIPFLNSNLISLEAIKVISLGNP